jgi:S-DNA-T family DNA segregation ATPase FtsK/SpoIIIE
MPTKTKKRPLKTRTPSRVKKRKPTTRRARPKAARPSHQHPELIGLGLLAVGAFLGSVLYLGIGGGAGGSALVHGIEAVVGAAVYGFPPALVALGGLMLFRSSTVDVRPFRRGLTVLTVGLLLVLGDAHGGALGSAADSGVGRVLGRPGVLILGVFLLLVGTLVLSNLSLGAWLRRSHAAARTIRERRPKRTAPARKPEPLIAEPVAIAAALAPPIDAVADYPDALHDEPPTDPISVTPPLLPEREPLQEDPPTLFDMEPASAHSDYKLPDRNVLRHSPEKAGPSPEANQRIGDALVETLSHFGVDARISGQISGPRVTRYELQLAPGTKVAKVAALKDDLSYALATTEIRILAPIPGKQAVGVEVPNLSPNIVTLGDIFDDLPAGASPLSVWLGKDISGNSVWTDLARMPHILIAGTTGSGKSGCINTILTSILLRTTPDDVRLILIDPKKVELNFYESIPHLMTPVVSNPKQASAVLVNVCDEMERRYERMSNLRARSLPELNRILRSRGEQPLPYLLVVIDELADLMMTSPQAVEDAIIRLAQKSRAVGIHLVLATQRPSVDVITGMIKANVPSRIAFAVSSMTDSRVILDQGGAESLLGQGDMLFKPLGTSRVQRVQGAYVSEEEVSLVVEQCRVQREQELDEAFLELPEVFADDAKDADEEFDPDEDPLLDKAIEIAVQTQTASVSLIQRRLRVGYTRAGRLIDMLERRGIISGYEGSKPRRVLVNEADLERVLTGS